MRTLLAIVLLALSGVVHAQTYNRVVIPVDTLAAIFRGQVVPVPAQSITWTEVTGYNADKTPIYGRQLIDYLTRDSVPPGAIYSSQMVANVCTEIVSPPSGFIFLHHFAGWEVEKCPTEAARAAARAAAIQPKN